MHVITGGSGYIGSRLVDLLSRRDDTERIVIGDLAPPRGYKPKTAFERLDVRDRDAVRSAVVRAKPDVLVHLAFILNPAHDEQLMYDVDVNGTHNVLEAAASAGTPQVLVTSSAVAYGAFPDNPVPLTEEDPRRARLLLRARQDRVRSHLPALGRGLPGPHDDDRAPHDRVRPERGQLPAPWTKQPFAVDVGNLDERVQFTHEEDVVEAITGLLLGRHGGAFNVAGDGDMTLRECAELLGTPIRKLPLRAYRGLAKAMWAARLSERASGADRVRSPPLADLEREAEEDHRLAAQAHEPRDVRDHHAGAREAAAGGPTGVVERLRRPSGGGQIRRGLDRAAPACSAGAVRPAGV